MFEIHPVRESEWKACRLLLPETFADFEGREYLLCTRAERPRIVAAASFRKTAEGVSGLRLQVIPPARRQGIGGLLVERICGGMAAEGKVEITRESAAEAFCARLGFVRVDGLTTVEAPIAEMRGYLRELRERIRMPGSARLISLAEAPMAQVARLHAEHVAQWGSLHPWRAALADRAAQLARSPILLLDGRVEGILLWEQEESLGIVRSRVVTQSLQGRWANAVLLAAALDDGWEQGVRRVQFSYTDSNRDTQKLARRFAAATVTVTARFRREGRPVIL